MLQIIITIILSSWSFLSVAEEDKIINMYNWSGYIPPDVINQFEKHTGIKVIYDVYDSDQILDAKLMSGKSEYDLVVPADSPYLGNEIKLGIFQKINKIKVKNYFRLNKEALQQLTIDDPNNTYAIPWMINTLGVAYNIDKIKALAPDAPINSLSLIFDPKYAEKFSHCGIGLLNVSAEMISTTLLYIGLDPNTKNLEDLDKAKEALAKIRPYINEIETSSYISNFANGDLCLIIGYSGDILQSIQRAKEANKEIDLQYMLPKEGFMVAYDVLAIPQHSKHPNNTLQFIDYLLLPEITAKVSNYTGFPSIIKESYKFLEPHIKNNKYALPTTEMLKKSFRISSQSSNFIRKRNRIWTNFVSSY